MWKPTNVVPKHRQRATLIWAGLILAALIYTAWQIGVMAVKRRNPGTSIALSNDNFRFPEITVCMYNGFGCGFADGSTDGCIATARNLSYATVDDGSPSTSSVSLYTYGTTFISPKETTYPNCVAFDLSLLDVVNNDQSRKPKAVLYMTWVSSDNVTADTDYSASVDVFVGGDTDGVDYTSVPYSRNEKPSTDDQFQETAMTIGKTHREYISKEPTTTFPVLTLSTTSYVSTKSQLLPSSSSSASFYENTIPSLTDRYAVGSLQLAITQGSYSLTKVRDIDPLEIGTLLGSIGGFWELLILTWGICFIANTRGSEPTMKGRNFSKSLQRGSSKVIRKKRKLDSPAPLTDGEEEQPRWDNVCISSESECEIERRGYFHREATVRPSSRPPLAQPLPKRARDVPGTKLNRGLVEDDRAARSSSDAMERGYARRASGDSYTPARWADMPRATYASTGGGRADAADPMAATTAPTPPASVRAVPNVHRGEIVVARSGFFARRSPSEDSLESHPEEAQEISDVNDSFDDRESIKRQEHGVEGDGEGGRESSQGTLAPSNDTAVAPSRHWAMPTDSPMSSNGRSVLRSAGFAPTSISFRDAHV